MLILSVDVARSSDFISLRCALASTNKIISSPLLPLALANPSHTGPLLGHISLGISPDIPKTFKKLSRYSLYPCCFKGEIHSIANSSLISFNKSIEDFYICVFNQSD